MRKFNWGDEDWYRTVSFIFASEDESSLSKEGIISIFEYYYKKFDFISTYQRYETSPLYMSLFRPVTLADRMFGDSSGIYYSIATSYKKRDLFKDLLKSFNKQQQYEILRCFFDYGRYVDGYDAKYLKKHIGSPDDEIMALIQLNEPLFRDEAQSIGAKRDVLTNLLRLLEPLRNNIKNIGKKYDVIFSMGNNLDIRHNNKKGDRKKEIVAGMPDDQLVEYYNDLFWLIKVVANLLGDESYYKHYDDSEQIIEKFKSLDAELKQKN